jgi:hypothetical protein
VLDTLQCRVKYARASEAETQWQDQLLADWLRNAAASAGDATLQPLFEQYRQRIEAKGLKELMERVVVL